MTATIRHYRTGRIRPHLLQETGNMNERKRPSVIVVGLIGLKPDIPPIWVARVAYEQGGVVLSRDAVGSTLMLDPMASKPATIRTLNSAMQFISISILRSGNLAVLVLDSMFVDDQYRGEWDLLMQREFPDNHHIRWVVFPYGLDNGTEQEAELHTSPESMADFRERLREAQVNAEEQKDTLDPVDRVFLLPDDAEEAIGALTRRDWTTYEESLTT